MHWKDIIAETYENNGWPTNVDEVFQLARADGHYFIDGDPMGNDEAMRVFLETIPEECITLDDGTCVYLANPKYNFMVRVDSGGGGDFHLHVFDLTVETIKSFWDSCNDHVRGLLNVPEWLAHKIHFNSIQETASVGSTSAGCVATVVQPLAGVQRRPIGAGFDPNGDWGIYQSAKEKPKKKKKKK